MGGGTGVNIVAADETGFRPAQIGGKISLSRMTMHVICSASILSSAVTMLCSLSKNASVWAVL